MELETFFKTHNNGRLPNLKRHNELARKCEAARSVYERAEYEFAQSLRDMDTFRGAEMIFESIRKNKFSKLTRRKCDLWKSRPKNDGV